MKNTKLYLVFLILGTLSFSAGLWVYSFYDKLDPFHYVLIVAVAISVLIGLIIGIKRLKTVKQGLPPEDELSNIIKTKATSMAFIYSFYSWMFILIITMDSHINRIEVPLGIGIVSMGVFLLGFWVYYSKKGVENGNPH